MEYFNEDKLLQMFNAVETTDHELLTQYEAIATSPLLYKFLTRAYRHAIKTAVEASSGKGEALNRMLRAKLRDFASTYRHRIRRDTLREITRLIAIIFAMLEGETRKGTGQASESFVYSYAIERGLAPDGELDERDKGIIGELSKRIFAINEAFILRAFTFEATPTNDNSTSMDDVFLMPFQEIETQNILEHVTEYNGDVKHVRFVVEALKLFERERSIFNKRFLETLGCSIQDKHMFAKMERVIIDSAPNQECVAIAQNSRYKELLNV